MEYAIFVIILIATIIVGITVMLAILGKLGSTTDELSDHYLYGMDSEEYLKEQVGEEYYDKYYFNR